MNSAQKNNGEKLDPQNWKLEIQIMQLICLQKEAPDSEGTTCFSMVMRGRTGRRPSTDHSFLFQARPRRGKIL